MPPVPADTRFHRIKPLSSPVPADPSKAPPSSRRQGRRPLAHHVLPAQVSAVFLQFLPSVSVSYWLTLFIRYSWLPLLFIPTNASPSFIFLFFVCTYFLNRPCLYCSFLLLILFLTSCNWSERCFIDFSSNWFQPRTGGSYVSSPGSGPGGNSTQTGEDLNATASAFLTDMVNTTAGALATAATEKLAQTRVEWTGLGLEWLRSLLGRREWRIDCLDLYIRL